MAGYLERRRHFASLRTLGVLRSLFSGVLKESMRIYKAPIPDEYVFGNGCKICHGKRAVSGGKFMPKEAADLVEKTNLPFLCVCDLAQKAAVLSNQWAAKRSGIPFGLWKNQSMAIGAIQRLVLAEKPPSVIVLSGEPGVGKTALVHWLWTYTSPFAALVDAMERSFMSAGELRESSKRLAKLPLIVFDEVGSEYDEASKSPVLLVRSVIDRVSTPDRNGYRMVIVVTNHARGNLREHVGQQLAHRLSLERGAAWIVMHKNDVEVFYGGQAGQDR